MKVPKTITHCRTFFLKPRHHRQRQYEALRACFVEGKSAPAVAEALGYSPGYVRLLCHHFRREVDPAFFLSPKRGPRSQPKKDAARRLAVSLRKQNHSVYEISEILKDHKTPLSPTAVREILKAEGFAALPRRLDEERPTRVGPLVEDVADVRSFGLAPGRWVTPMGGLFLLLPDLISMEGGRLAQKAGLPGSKHIPAPHALRAELALKLWGIERKSHVSAYVADRGLALFCGLNVIPKKSFLSEYSSRVTHAMTLRLLAQWHEQVGKQDLFRGRSLNLDFHSVPYYGEDPVVENHYVSARSRSQPSVQVFLAQDAEGRAFCYSNADIRKGEEADEVFRFLRFWKRTRGDYPQELVFDSRLTTHANWARLDAMDIRFITVRRRSAGLHREMALIEPSEWQVVELDVPSRKYRTPRVVERKVTLAERKFRQFFIKDLGHDQPTILVTNHWRQKPSDVITRYAHRMLIENALADAVRFFHMDALSSAVGLKVDFDMALLVIASGLYRLFARRMRGYQDAQARKIFRDLVNLPAEIRIDEREVVVDFYRRAHLPVVLASGLFEKPIRVPWWGDPKPLRLTTYMGR